MTRLVPRALVATAVAALALVLSGCEFWQYNIGNGASPRLHGENDVIREVVSNGNRAVAMSLQEVCGTSAYRIQAELGRYGYHVDFDNISPNGCDGTGYGNAVVHLGNHVPFFGNPDGRYEVHFTTQSGHHRHAMVVGVGIGNLRMMVWTAHLESASDSTASAQASELLDQVRQWQARTGWLTVVGGDFNLTPGQFPMGNWCGAYWESFLCSSSVETHPAGKIDYLFSSLRWKAARGGSYPVNSSDHSLIRGNLLNGRF